MPSFLKEAAADKVRSLKTLCLVTGYAALGLATGTVGPTLLDLRQQTSTDLTTISFVPTLRSAGHAIGSIIMGLMMSRVNFQLTTAALFMTTAGITLAIPYINMISVLLPVFLINQVPLGMFEAGCNMFVLHLWGKSVTPFMQALHLGYGAGAIVGPITAVPFLVETNDASTGNATHAGSSNNSRHTYRKLLNETAAASYDVDLLWPYTIVAAFAFANAAFFLVVWYLFPKTTAHASRLPQADETSPLLSDTANDRQQQRVGKGTKIELPQKDGSGSNGNNNNDTVVRGQEAAVSRQIT